MRRNGWINFKRIFFTPSNIFISLLGGFILYQFIIPFLYVREFNFPKPSEIHQEEGVFIYQRYYRDGYSPGVKKNDVERFFSCKSFYSRYFSRCEVSGNYLQKFNDSQEKAFDAWKGKSAKISWFYQKVNLFVRQKRVVEIVIDGQVVLSKERVKDDIYRVKRRWFSKLVFKFFIFLALFFIAWLFSPKVKNE